MYLDPLGSRMMLQNRHAALKRFIHKLRLLLPIKVQNTHISGHFWTLMNKSKSV